MCRPPIARQFAGIPYAVVVFVGDSGEGIVHRRLPGNLSEEAVKLSAREIRRSNESNVAFDEFG